MPYLSLKKSRIFTLNSPPLNELNYQTNVFRGKILFYFTQKSLSKTDSFFTIPLDFSNLYADLEIIRCFKKLKNTKVVLLLEKYMNRTKPL